jgi:hypothetical protein
MQRRDGEEGGSGSERAEQERIGFGFHGIWLVLCCFFERVMDGLCGPRLAARLCQKENMHYSKKLIIELLRQFNGLLRQFLLP